MNWRWREASGDAVELIAKHFSLAKPIAHILVNREIDTIEKVDRFIHVELSHIGSPHTIQGVDRACERIWQAIQSSEKVIVHGDFDADGITSSALLYLFFKELGYPVEVFIPNRLEEGHGLSRRFINLAVEKECKLVITCDCGSSNEKEIAELKSLGIDTIVTDHHHVHQELFSGILVNPKENPGESSPEELSGVGVVFMLLMALRKHLREKNFFAASQEPNLKKYLDIVALGTIADMAPLVGYNRVLVVKGLEELHKTSRPGFVAMKEKAGIHTMPYLHSYDVGFKLAPKINAAARLGKAMDAFDTIVSEHPLQSASLSQRLEDCNLERRKIQERMIQLCSTELERQRNYAVHVFASKDFHPGVCGLAAQKLSQETGKPVFVFRLENGVAKGSARCKPPYSIMNLLDAVKDLLVEYGGHSEAGGCKLAISNVQAFTQRLQEVANLQNASGKKPQLWVDASVELDDLNFDFVHQVRRLGPFGPGHVEPVFSAPCTVVEHRQVGSGHLKATVASLGGGRYSCIAFNRWKDWNTEFRGKITLYFYAKENWFNGQPSLSLDAQGFSRDQKSL